MEVDLVDSLHVDEAENKVEAMMVLAWLGEQLNDGDEHGVHGYFQVS